MPSCGFVHAISYQRLSRLLSELFGPAISEGALDAAFRRGKLHVDAEVAAILTRLRRVSTVCSDETSVRFVIDAAARPGVGTYDAIQQTLRGQPASYPG